MSTHNLSGGKGRPVNRWAESAVVANVSAFGEQVIGARVGQGALRCPAGWVSILNVVEYLGEFAENCGLVPLRAMTGRWGFAPTDSATNAIVGPRNVGVPIAPGGVQSFVFDYHPSALISGDVELWFDCENTDAVQTLVGLNTFGLTVVDRPTVDMVALTATPSGDGILRLPGASGLAAFALASVNVGISETIHARVVASETTAVAASLCKTDSTTGQCEFGQAPLSEILLDVGANATPTFSVFVQALAEVPLDPAVNRIRVEFVDLNGRIVGSSSVAVTTR